MPIQYFTDSNAVCQKREVFKTQMRTGILTLEVDEKPCATGFEGFGVAITGSSCYQLNLMTEAERTALLKDIYTDSGLGLSIGRLTIGSSDYSAEVYSYDDVPFDTSLEHFSIEKDEKYIIPMIKEILKIKPDLKLFASPWSPPAWMKTSNDLGEGYMRNEYIDCYAEYIIKYLKAYLAHGIKISAITPQNEPEVHHRGTSVACIWHPETEAEYIKVLRKKLNENNLDVEIWMYDHDFTGAQRVLWSLENIENLRESCDGIAFHYYTGNIEQTLPLLQKYPELKLHYTESGPRIFENYDTDWCKWGIMMMKVLKCGYSSFTGWNLALDELGGPNVGHFSCGGLVTRHSLTGELSYSGQYKAFKHIAKYINKKSRIYNLTANEWEYNSMYQYPNSRKGLAAVMIDNGDSKVFVMANPDSEKKQVQFTAKGELWYAELMPDTLSAIIV